MEAFLHPKQFLGEGLGDCLDDVVTVARQGAYIAGCCCSAHRRPLCAKISNCPYRAVTLPYSTLYPVQLYMQAALAFRAATHAISLLQEVVRIRLSLYMHSARVSTHYYRVSEDSDRRPDTD